MASVDVPSVIPTALATGRAHAKPKPTLAVSLWAGLGAICLAFILVIWALWVTGPYFKEVPAGPSDQPGWMDTLQTVWEPLFFVIALAMLWWFLVRPWRRDGHPSTDGLLCVAIALLFFQDPLSSFTGHWFTYNANLAQMGSWVNEIPGWMAFGDPGANVPEPLVFTTAVYVWAFFGMTLLGCWVMTQVRRRRPTMSTPALIGSCFLALFVADIVLEGFIWVPLGFVAYPGGHWNLNDGEWYQYPIHEGITAGALFTGLASLRFFKNDKGETFADRGANKLSIRPGRRHVLRFLAFVGASQMIMMVTYNIPVATFIASHPAEWPKSIQERSYLTNYVCGSGTTRLCPQPGLPTISHGTVNIGPNGQVVVPEQVTLPENFVPFRDERTP